MRLEYDPAMLEVRKGVVREPKSRSRELSGAARTRRLHRFALYEETVLPSQPLQDQAIIIDADPGQGEADAIGHTRCSPVSCFNSVGRIGSLHLPWSTTFLHLWTYSSTLLNVF